MIRGGQVCEPVRRNHHRVDAAPHAARDRGRRRRPRMAPFRHRVGHPGHRRHLPRRHLTPPLEIWASVSSFWVHFDAQFPVRADLTTGRRGRARGCPGPTAPATGPASSPVTASTTAPMFDRQHPRVACHRRRRPAPEAGVGRRPVRSEDIDMVADLEGQAAVGHGDAHRPQAARDLCGETAEAAGCDPESGDDLTAPNGRGHDPADRKGVERAVRDRRRRQLTPGDVVRTELSPDVEVVRRHRHPLEAAVAGDHVLGPLAHRHHDQRGDRDQHRREPPAASASAVPSARTVGSPAPAGRAWPRPPVRARDPPRFAELEGEGRRS